MQRILALKSVVATSLAIETAAQPCYFSNGSMLPYQDNFDLFNQWVTCEGGASNARNTMCCKLNPMVQNSRTDVCLPNGICAEFNNYPGTTAGALYWRGFCSSSNSTLCNFACSHMENRIGGAQMTPCGNAISNRLNGTERWCCGASDDCCSDDDDPNLVIISKYLNGNAIQRDSQFSSSVAGPSPSGTPAATNASVSETLSTGAKAGAGVAVAVGGLILIAVGYSTALYLAKRRNRKSSMGGATSQSEMEQSFPARESLGRLELTGPEPQELHSEHPTELMGQEHLEMGPASPQSRTNGKNTALVTRQELTA